VTAIDVLDVAGNASGTVDLPAEIFDVQVNIPLIHQVVVAQQAAARQGTHSTKRRGEVRGGGRKPYRQKGTGRARQGSIRAPQFVGGGVVHGPTPHLYLQRTPKKMKVAALRGALSDRARDGRIFVVEGLVDGDSASTKAALTAIARITQRPRTLVVLERGDDKTWLSLRNVDTVHALTVDQLNTYDVLLSDDVVFIKSAFDILVAGVTGGSVTESDSTDSDSTDSDSTDSNATETAGASAVDTASEATADAVPVAGAVTSTDDGPVAETADGASIDEEATA
jgi:large subunit ribosomal protein L4